MDWKKFKNNKYLKYLSYTLKHKYYVLKYGLKFGVPIINLVLHDWDKFLPRMIYSYANYFYGDKKISTENGYFHKPGENDVFDLNWLKHIHLNKHHWQHWILQNDEDGKKVLCMPINDTLEMLADWYGAAMAQNNPDVKKWYLKHYHNIILHSKTRNFVNEFLGVSYQEIPILEEMKYNIWAILGN